MMSLLFIIDSFFLQNIRGYCKKIKITRTHIPILRLLIEA